MKTLRMRVYEYETEESHSLVKKYFLFGRRARPRPAIHILPKSPHDLDHSLIRKPNRPLLSALHFALLSFETLLLLRWSWGGQWQIRSPFPDY